MAFFFCLTNPGLESALKFEMKERFPRWRLAFSAPGFITFKGEGAWPVPYLARLWGECLGKGHEGEGEVLEHASGVWRIVVHTPAPLWPRAEQLSGLQAPEDVPSRAWLKIEEAIRLFELPLKSGETAIELGAAPGGAVRALLDRGLHVRAVDPAHMHASLLQRPNWVHLRRPFQELTLHDIEGVDWWLSDLNLAPGSVLSHLGRLLRDVPKPKGLILTLKLAKPEVAREIRQHEARVREWGYGRVQVRLLPSHHQEVALVARP